jgi:hypothetical protein
MKRNKRNAPKRIVRSPRSAPTFAYAEVESALAKVFDAEDAQPGAFRARLKHFRKLGIPAKNPGKGARVRYSESDLLQLLIALELTEFGLDPALIVKIIRRDWVRRNGFYVAIQAAIPNATQLYSSEDIYAVMRVSVMSATLGRRGIIETDEGLSLRSEPSAVTVKFTLGNADLTQFLQEPGVRLSVFNLSNRIRSLLKEISS